LGDPIRLRILELLRGEGELSVGELVDRLALPQPKVSNHLACLRWCGFVEARQEGRTVYNRIADPRVAAMLGLAQSLLADNAEHVAACCRIEEAGR
jgi:DNA-binding transcriptional ArsR family regulator